MNFRLQKVKCSFITRVKYCVIRLYDVCTSTVYSNIYLWYYPLKVKSPSLLFMFIVVRPYLVITITLQLSGFLL
jgi:hypothetical protein